MKLYNDVGELIVALYLAIAVVTFGHAWHGVPATEEHSFGGVNYTVHNGPGTRLIAGVASAIAWPFYWSVKAWEK